MNLESIAEQAIDTAKRAGRYALNQRATLQQQHIEIKGEHNFVSHIDRQCEQMLVNDLSLALPQAGFIAEEGTGSPNADGLNWVIDPLDGTTNYIHSLAPHAVSIALLEHNTPLLGVIYEPNLDECFWATSQSPAYLNGTRINVSHTPTVHDALVATGFPYYDYTRLDGFMRSMEHLMRHSHGLRRLGSAATDLAYVAAGRFDAFYEYGLSPWDVAAGAIIVQRAGGSVCDYGKGNNYIFGKEIIATNTLLHNEFTQIIAQYIPHQTA